LPSQKARVASYNLLLLLRKDCLFCHRSECYGPPSPSISLESIMDEEKSLDLIDLCHHNTVATQG